MTSLLLLKQLRLAQNPVAYKNNSIVLSSAKYFVIPHTVLHCLREIPIYVIEKRGIFIWVVPGFSVIWREELLFGGGTFFLKT